MRDRSRAVELRCDRSNRIRPGVGHGRNSGRRLQEMIVDQAHSLLAHLGAYKTLLYLREFVWWRFMAKDVEVFCASCKTCQQSKPSMQKPYGLLNPLSVPANPWEAVGIDFVGPLPSAKDRNSEYDSITVIIDLLTAMVHLVPSRDNYTTKDVAELMFVEVYRHHGLPRAIISDHDVLFTSTFWTHLNQLIGVKMKMSSAYHPETDGSTERANRMVGQMLRSCIGPTQHDWVLKLPAIEFAINSAHSESTGYAPFFLNTGRMPRSMIWNAPEGNEYPSVRVYAQKMKNALMAAHDALLTARVKQTEQANKKRRMCPFVKGDLVYVSTKNVRLERGTSRKLFPKFIGPYLITEDFGNSSYRVNLPDSLKQRGVHNVFHASLLRVHIPNDDRLFPGRQNEQIPELGGSNGEWMINRILTHQGSNTDLEFKVEWSSGDQTWVPHLDLEGSTALGKYLKFVGVKDVSDLQAP